MGCQVTHPHHHHIPEVKIHPVLGHQLTTSSQVPKDGVCRDTTLSRVKKIHDFCMSRTDEFGGKCLGNFDILTVDNDPQAYGKGVRFNLLDPNFDPFGLSFGGLISVAEEILGKDDTETTLGISKEKARNFVSRMAGLYNSGIPFHNFNHAIAVLQMVFRLSILNLGFSKVLTDLERTALFLAALGHDVNHPGVTNGFLLKSKHTIAEKFNGKSVLENYHCALVLLVLEQPDCDVFSHLQITQVSKVKQFISACILSTDISLQPELIRTVGQILPVFSKENPQHRSLAGQLILHAADIGNQAYDSPLCEKWAKNIEEEFRLQVLLEKEEQVPITPTFDIKTETESSTGQATFIRLLALPCWHLLHSLFPYVQEYLDRLQKNEARWRDGQNSTERDYN